MRSMSLGSIAAWREAAGPGYDEPDDGPAVQRRHCYCGAFLCKEPNDSMKVMDEILSWGETEPDEEGRTEHYPLECSWYDEPLWTCKRCGHTYDSEEMFD